MSGPPKELPGTPKFPPFTYHRPPTWRCLLIGCIFEWQRVDAWWEQEHCRWCRSTRGLRQSIEHVCARCGQRLPKAPRAAEPPPILDLCHPGSP